MLSCSPESFVPPLSPLKAREIRGLSVGAGLQSTARANKIRHRHVGRKRIPPGLPYFAFDIDRRRFSSIRISMNQQAVTRLEQDIRGRIAADRPFRLTLKIFSFPSGR